MWLTTYNTMNKPSLVQTDLPALHNPAHIILGTAGNQGDKQKLRNTGEA